MRKTFYILTLLFTSFSVYGQEIFKSDLIGVKAFYNFNDSTVNISIFNKTDSVIYLRYHSEYSYVTDKTESGIINITCSSILLPQPWPPQDDIQLFAVNTLILLPKKIKTFKYFETYPNDSFSYKSNIQRDSFRISYSLEYIISKEKIKFKDDLPNYLFIQKLLKKDLNVYRFYGNLRLNTNPISESCYSLLIEETYFKGTARVPNLLSKESKKRIRWIKKSGRYYWWLSPAH